MTRSFVLLGAMDSFARGLKNAAKLIEDGTLDSLVKVSLKLLSLFCLEKIEFFLLQMLHVTLQTHLTFATPISSFAGKHTAAFNRDLTCVQICHRK